MKTMSFYLLLKLHIIIFYNFRYSTVKKKDDEC